MAEILATTLYIYACLLLKVGLVILKTCAATGQTLESSRQAVENLASCLERVKKLTQIERT